MAALSAACAIGQTHGEFDTHQHFDASEQWFPRYEQAPVVYFKDNELTEPGNGALLELRLGKLVRLCSHKSLDCC